MQYTQPEIFGTVGLITIFFLLLVTIIIFTALQYHTRKRVHKIEVSNFQNVLMQAQLEVQEQTMQTIGADLHDNIGQLLSLTSLTLKSIELDNDQKNQKKVEAVIDLTVRAIKEMRQLGKLLQGDQLIALGLLEAIQYEIEWLERSGKYMVTYTHDDEIPVGYTDKNLIVFRILQEVLNNIIKHSSASRINIKLSYLAPLLHLYVNDNGIGFDMEAIPAAKKGMGLHNINKRAGIIGGEVTIKSKPGEGTGITIIIPYQ
jgi:two-component system NarL family sensor kinase